MAIAMITARQGNGSFDCGGAQVRAHCRHLATVVTVRGEIDAVNVDRVSEYVRRFILGDNPVVLDMSDVSHFAGAGFSLLYTFDEDCRAGRGGVDVGREPDGRSSCWSRASGDSRSRSPRSVPEALRRPGRRGRQPPPAGTAAVQEDGLAP